MLLGRTRELQTLVAACRAAEAGNGATLVVRGEPGIGKSALLSALAETDERWRHLRATGVEAESSAPLATLQALLWPLRDELDDLDASQVRLLRAVLDLTPQEGMSTFALGAAVLSVLSHASRAGLVVASVDDAHWADTSSQEVLAIVGRRLAAEHLVLLVTSRTGHAGALADEPSFTTIDLGPLDRESSRSLIEQSAVAPLPTDVMERLLEVCAGNPLGLVELPGLFADAKPRGHDSALEVGPLVQRAFAARIATLDEKTRAALLLLAAGDAAAASLLLGDDAAGLLAPAEGVGVLAMGGRWEFRHPLLRASVYASATPAERREAHRQLASVLAGARRAWHLAEAADGPDEAVALELEAAAAQSRTAGGVAAEAEALERAAELSEHTDTRAGRLRAAGRAWRRAGRIGRSNELLTDALAAADAESLRGRIQLDRGLNFLRDGARREAYDLLVVEARRYENSDPVIAARLFAALALVANVDVGGPSAVSFAERAHELVGARGDEVELEVLFSLVSARMSRPVPPDDDDFALVERATALLGRRELRDGEQPHWIAYALAELELDSEARALSDLALAEARAAGDVWSLCYGSYARAETELVLGRLDAARAWSAEAVPLADQIGEQWRSEQAAFVDAEVQATRGIPSDDGPGLLRGRALLATGQATDAIPDLEDAARENALETPRGWYRLVSLDLAEAYAIAGRVKEAASVLADAAPGIERCRLVRPQVRLGRVRGLLAPDAKIDAAFGAARSLLEDAPHPFEEARVELAWGERLVLAGRAADAVPHLEHALTGFDALGATGWSARARRALAGATGTSVPTRAVRTDVLSAQELRVARHAAGGARDREIAALLYLSPRTVEAYLQSSYRKLGVGNRTQLAALLASEGITPLEVS